MLLLDDLRSLFSVVGVCIRCSCPNTSCCSKSDREQKGCPCPCPGLPTTLSASHLNGLNLYAVQLHLLHLHNARNDVRACASHVYSHVLQRCNAEPKNKSVSGDHCHHDWPLAASPLVSSALSTCIHCDSRASTLSRDIVPQRCICQEHSAA